MAAPLGGHGNSGKPPLNKGIQSVLAADFPLPDDASFESPGSDPRWNFSMHEIESATGVDLIPQNRDFGPLMMNDLRGHKSRVRCADITRNAGFLKGS
jgi:hypothetical protein